MSRAEVQRWREEGAALRERLTTQRATLVAQITDIDTALRELPAPEAAGASAPDRVLSVLATASAPMTAAEIRAALPEVTSTAIGNALHRLTERRVLRATGPRGRQRYEVAAPSPGPEWKGTGR